MDSGQSSSIAFHFKKLRQLRNNVILYVTIRDVQMAILEFVDQVCNTNSLRKL